MTQTNLHIILDAAPQLNNALEERLRTSGFDPIVLDRSQLLAGQTEPFPASQTLFICSMQRLEQLRHMPDWRPSLVLCATPHEAASLLPSLNELKILATFAPKTPVDIIYQRLAGVIENYRSPIRLNSRITTKLPAFCGDSVGDLPEIACTVVSLSCDGAAIRGKKTALQNLDLGKVRFSLNQNQTFSLNFRRLYLLDHSSEESIIAVRFESHTRIERLAIDNFVGTKLVGEILG